jgi:hypothetical protein
MSRIIICFLAVLMTSAPVLSSEAKAQQTNFRQVLPPGNQNLMAIDAAVQKGDMKGAQALTQANRLAWGSQQGFALAAMNGTQGKPPDISAAIDAANKAEQHVLDGSNVKFAHAASGQITATVTRATGGQPQVISLTPDQFKQFLNIGDNHWDKLMNRTVPATLQMISSGQMYVGPQPQAKPRARQDASVSGTGGTEASSKGDPWARQFEDEHGPERTKFDPKTDDEIIYRSHRIFPDFQNEPARQQWIVAQKQQAIANEINRTKPLIYPVNGR